jgi:DNA (cytosine-5)-methyltransferase 1
MEDASLDQAVIWDDVATFDGRPWCGAVDIISAGYR